MISGGSPTLQLGPLSQAVTSFLREATLMLGWGLSSFQTSSVFVHTVMCERVIYGFSSKMGTRELLEMTDPRNIAGNSLVPFRGARVVPAGLPSCNFSFTTRGLPGPVPHQSVVLPLAAFLMLRLRVGAFKSPPG